jgi:hypothetical protein
MAAPVLKEPATRTKAAPSPCSSYSIRPREFAR